MSVSIRVCLKLIRNLYRLSKLDDFMNRLYQIYLQVKKEGIAQVSSHNREIALCAKRAKILTQTRFYQDCQFRYSP